MLARSFKIGLSLLTAGVVGAGAAFVFGQDIAPPVVTAPAEAAADVPAVPKGVEVLTRGPIHEAFAAPTVEAAPTKQITKQPPAPLNEEPPAEKPDGEAAWIGGYWAWDDDRNDFLWVSGTWRATPPGKQWVAGYWRGDDEKWQWVPGFWTNAAAKEADAQQFTYLPQPPAQPNVATPSDKPNPDSFYVPGHWVWRGDQYRWQAGYWAKVEPGFVWVPGHYRWTPGGYVYIAGYWDYALSKRGMLYAPVVIDTTVVGATYVYTPTYAVHETVIVDAMWVRPAHCHYYFGDYYGAEYRERGFESCVVYSRGHYDSIIVYETWEHRREPEWVTIRINDYHDRDEHRESRPPRTLVEQVTIVNKGPVVEKKVVMVEPASKVCEAKGVKTVVVERETRVQIQEQAVKVREVSVQRGKTEVAAPGGAPRQPHVATLGAAKEPPPAPKAPAAGTHQPTTPVINTTGAHTTPPAPTTTHPPAQLQPATSPPSPYGAANAAKTPPLASPYGPTGTKPTTPAPPGTGQPTMQPGAHPGQPPAKPTDPPQGHKPPAKDKDKDAKDKDKDKNQ